MRKLILSAICGFISAAAMAATISGTVTNNLAQPVPNQVIYAQDTFAMTWSDSAITDASGNYSMTIPGTMPNNTGILVSTHENCVPYYMEQGFNYTGSNITANFTVCYAAPATIQGTVTSTNPAMGDTAAMVYLINQGYDSVNNTHILTAIDSTATDGAGHYSFSVPASYDTLLVKAAEQSFSPDYANYLPTYYTSSLMWSGATPVSPNTTADIQLIAGTNPGGPAFIAGDVLQGANKSTAVGDPLNKRILILTTNTNVPVAYAYSNAAGHFSFPSLAYGTYKIFGDAPGKSNPALTITLDAQHQSISNIIFEEHSHIFDGHIATAVVNVKGNLSGISLFPNPAVDNINVMGLETVSGAKTITISSTTGATVYTHTFNNGEKAVVPVSNLSKGIYMLNVNTVEGTATFKVVK
ncbi:MAG: T9SS type A sorting domain-containing protein [Bacteroidetes bacterium]|nr:T9SS type A sorting domain-containing protein [Bacteroidota bacterium]